VGVQACRRASYVVYANALSYVIACVIFLYLKIFVCLIKQASLLAIISKFVGRGDNSILWLSFAQQKLSSGPFVDYASFVLLILRPDAEKRDPEKVAKSRIERRERSNVLKEKVPRFLGPREDGF
jgi:hypothetical protein